MIVWHTDRDDYAMSVGPVIVVGKRWKALPKNEQEAVLAHEQGHIREHHSVKRLWLLVTFRWRGLMRRCQIQELEADCHAVQSGHHEGMLAFLTRIRSHYSPLHPTFEERVANIRRCIDVR